jgi:hypothetical protein
MSNIHTVYQTSWDEIKDFYDQWHLDDGIRINEFSNGRMGPIDSDKLHWINWTDNNLISVSQATANFVYEFINRNYNITNIAYMIWNLMPMGDNKDFETKFFGEDHKMNQYGYDFLKKDNGSLFIGAYNELVNEYTTNRRANFIGGSGNITLKGACVDWRIRKNISDEDRLHLYLTITYSENRIYPQALYENLWWLFLHRQMYMLLSSSFENLGYGNLIINEHTRSEKTSGVDDYYFYESMNSGRLTASSSHIFDEDELIIINPFESYNILKFSNWDGLKYLYKIFKEKKIEDLVNIDNYYTMMFKNI